MKRLAKSWMSHQKSLSASPSMSSWKAKTPCSPPCSASPTAGNNSSSSPPSTSSFGCSKALSATYPRSHGATSAKPSNTKSAPNSTPTSNHLKSVGSKTPAAAASSASSTTTLISSRGFSMAASPASSACSGTSSSSEPYSPQHPCSSPPSP